MSWQYIHDINSVGRPQCFNYQTSPPVEVCCSCHQPYTNHGAGNTCDECRGENHPEEEETSFAEQTNEYGFPQMYQIEASGRTPVCPQCHAMVLPNHGNGTMCTGCQNAFDLECEHDREME